MPLRRDVWRNNITEFRYFSYTTNSKTCLRRLQKHPNLNSRPIRMTYIIRSMRDDKLTRCKRNPEIKGGHNPAIFFFDKTKAPFEA